MTYFTFSSYSNNPSTFYLKKDQRGFTFIELLIVISLISFLSIIGIAAFVTYSNVQAFNSGVSDVVSMLNIAKSRAQSQVAQPTAAVCGTNNNSIRGYGVRFAGRLTYDLRAICDDDLYHVVPGTAKDLTTYGLTHNHNVQYIVRFNGLTGNVISTSPIIITGFGMTRTITIDSSGNIAVN